MPLLAGFAISAIAVTCLWYFKAAKAIAPTVTCTPVANFATLNATAAGLTVTALGVSGRYDVGLVNPTVASGLVAGNATQLIANSGGTDARIIAEANP